jgi:hypothetical protein
MSLLGGDKGLSALIGAGFRRLQSYMVTLSPQHTTILSHYEM